MKLACAALLGLGLSALLQGPEVSTSAELPLDLCWAPGLGRVEVVQTGPRRLRLDIEGPSGALQRQLELTALPERARLREARIAAYMESGLVLALVVDEGDTHSYRFASTRQLAPGLSVESVGREAPGPTSWWLSEPIFSDAEEPYRIVEVHNPGGDTLEITFRRGRVPLARAGDSQLDERIFVDTCPGMGPALQTGRAELLRVEPQER